DRFLGDDLNPTRAAALNVSLPGGTTSNAQAFAAQQCMPYFSSNAGNASGKFRSQHAGGFFVAMCDGSVRFVSDTVEVGVKSGVYDWAWDNSPSGMGTWERLNASGDGLVLDDTSDPNFS